MSVSCWHRSTCNRRINCAARDQLTEAREYYEAVLKKTPEDVDARLLLARAHASLGDLGEAAKLVEKPLPDVTKGEQGTSDPKLVDAWIQLCLSQVGAEMNKPEPDWTRILSLLDEAFKKAPNDPRLLAAIAVVVSQHEGEGFERLRSGLEDVLADGRAPATCHLVLGTALGVKGDLEPAIRHLRAAQKSLPENPLIANNLAMFLMQLDPAPLEECSNWRTWLPNRCRTSHMCSTPEGRCSIDWKGTTRRCPTWKQPSTCRLR